MVTLTIDGIEVTVDRGSTILQAAEEAGVRIPTLCHDKRLIPFGACRMCVVAIKGRKGRLIPACFNPARNGMEILTNTPEVIEARRIQLELLLRHHPLDCPVCEAGGACQLQSLVYEYEIGELPFPRGDTDRFPVDRASHFIQRDMNRCILCGCCVRICSEVQGVGEWSFINRGIKTEIATDFHRPLNCEFCGQCVSACPTGALTAKYLVTPARPWEQEKTETICPFCSVGCTIVLGTKDSKLVRVTSEYDLGFNEGNLCVKGRFGWPYAQSPERIARPLVRREDRWVEVDWNEALRTVADGFMRIIEKYGSDHLAGLGSARLTNEEAYVFQRFLRTVLGTLNLDHAGGYGYEGLLNGLGRSLGIAASTNSIREIRSSDAILALRADLTETHPVAKNEVIFALERGKIPLIVVDSVRTSLAERSNLPLIGHPGTESALINGLIWVILEEEMVDNTFIRYQTIGFDEFKGSIRPYSPREVQGITGVDADLIVRGARAFAKAKKASILLIAGMNQTGQNVELARAAANLAMITGNLGKKGGGIFLFGEKCNSQGALDMGLTPHLLPGYQDLYNPAVRQRFQQAWGRPLPEGKGLNAREIIRGARDGQIKGLYIVGENPLVMYPCRQDIEAAMERIEFLVVQDTFLSATAKKADVVLPVATFAEKAGSYTNAERRVQWIRQALVPLEAVKTDLNVFQALSFLLGKEIPYSNPEGVLDEINRMVPDYGGITANRIKEGGLQWPCPKKNHPGTPILYEQGFNENKAEFAPAYPFKKEKTPRTKALPYALLPRIVKFHSGSMSTRSPSLMEVYPRPVLEVSLEDAVELGLKSGEPAVIRSEKGELQVEVAVARSAKKGTVLITYHFEEILLNDLMEWEGGPIRVQIQKA